MVSFQNQWRSEDVWGLWTADSLRPLPLHFLFFFFFFSCFSLSFGVPISCRAPGHCPPMPPTLLHHCSEWSGRISWMILSHTCPHMPVSSMTGVRAVLMAAKQSTSCQNGTRWLHFLSSCILVFTCVMFSLSCFTMTYVVQSCRSEIKRENRWQSYVIPPGKFGSQILDIKYHLKYEILLLICQYTPSYFPLVLHQTR